VDQVDFTDESSSVAGGRPLSMLDVAKLIGDEGGGGGGGGGWFSLKGSPLECLALLIKTFPDPGRK